MFSLHAIFVDGVGWGRCGAGALSWSFSAQLCKVLAGATSLSLDHALELHALALLLLLVLALQAHCMGLQRRQGLQVRQRGVLLALSAQVKEWFVPGSLQLLVVQELLFALQGPGQDHLRALICWRLCSKGCFGICLILQ